MNNRIPYVYVISTSYSGSTLLSVLVNAHPQVVSIGELANSIGALMKRGGNHGYYCSCGLEIRHCRFWENVTNLCLQNGIELDLHSFDTNLNFGHGKYINKMLFGIAKRFTSLETLRDRLLWMVPVFRNRITSLMHRNAILVQSILMAADKKIFLDASKDAKMAYYLTKNKNPDFKVIHLVRDIRGFINSCRKYLGEGYFEKALNNWLRVNQAALKIKSNLPSEAYLLVKYERLCNNTAETIEEICEFIGVNPVDLVTAAKGQQNHIIGNSMRLRPFNSIQVDEKWKKELPADYITECLKRSVLLRKEVGYE